MRALISSLLLSLSACGEDAVPLDEGWVGDPAPDGTYAMPIAAFTELCEDGSDRSVFQGLTASLEARPEAVGGLFTLDLRVKLADGGILENEAWGEVGIGPDGAFDTGGRARAARLDGRFERDGQEARALGALFVELVEPDYVLCVRTYEF